MDFSRRKLLAAATAGGSLSALNACARPLAMTHAPTPPSSSLDALFARTKLQCFGRYAVELPAETEQVFGFQQIAGGFKQFPTEKFPDAAALMHEHWKEVLIENRSAQRLIPLSNGPAAHAKYVWYYEDDDDRRDDTRMLDAAIRIGRTIYLYEGMSAHTEHLSPEDLFARMTALMRGMRAWDGHTVPREPGVCIEGAFIHEPTHRFQEIMSSGFYFPSLPDVSFSVLSNKNASTQDENGRGLLQSIEVAQHDARRFGLFGGYPYTFLRRGKRTLHGLWDGEEMLSKSRDDQALRFEWKLVGQTGNVARPAHLDIAMSTRVQDNRVGAAAHSSVTDAQAVALWDRLLDNVKFRVAVPGATPQAVALG